MKRSPFGMRVAVAGGIGTVLLLLTSTAPSWAQDAAGGTGRAAASPPTAASPTSPPSLAPTSDPITQEKPDLAVVVFPFPNGQTAISTVYPKTVPQAEALTRVGRLIVLTGWEPSEPVFENKAMTMEKKGVNAPVMSSVSLTANGTVFGLGGTVLLEPFLVAFRDLNVVHLTFATPPGFKYTGPTHFSDPRVEFYCHTGKGAVVCAAKIKDHSIKELNLPTHDTGSGDGSDPEKTAGAATNRGVSPFTLILIVLASLATGAGVFLVALLMMRRGGGR